MLSHYLLQRMNSKLAEYLKARPVSYALTCEKLTRYSILEWVMAPRIIWAVRFEGHPKYIAIGHKGAEFQVTGKCFEKIPDMVKYYMTTREPIHSTLKIIVKRAVPHKEWLISHDRVRLEDEIGKGAFGKVFKGTLQVGHDFQTVAVKTYAGQTKDRKKRAAFLQEARTMREYKHENVLQVIGIACQKEPLMIVLEFCGGGSLLQVCYQTSNL
uniref:Non-specific protein-tyrosine kinase n=1 Tax=Ascaris lumbricoides TaxID=6252 RepID=A0A0M3IRL1_ASCLU